jgi:GNAT superfamily N-acetyltransferase
MDGSTTRITLSETADRAFEAFLHDRIKQFNNEASPFHRRARKLGEINPLNIILEDQYGTTIGGLAATTYWGWLDIEDFYIPPEYRGRGLGKKILAMAEERAQSRDCRSAHLTTYDFQAKSFYEKRDWFVVGRLENYPPGLVYYWMRKDFDPADRLADR